MTGSESLDEQLDHQLDNPAWFALGSVHAEHASSARDLARRYPRRMSPFGALATLEPAGWDAMLELVGPGGAVVLARTDRVAEPDGWTCLFRGGGTQYVCHEPDALPSLDTVDLGDDDVEEMLELTSLTKPGPFVPRTHEMGHYIGVRHEGRLVAMAGERLRSDGFSEISAVCVHPDARRQGLAAKLTTILAHEIVDQGRLPMLHVAEGNDAAHAVYRGIGFEPRSEMEFTAFRHVVKEHVVEENGA
ncbi:MAG: GNAT family N-acetyltransferase [Actinomycetota bacterium]